MHTSSKARQRGKIDYELVFPFLVIMAVAAFVLFPIVQENQQAKKAAALQEKKQAAAAKKDQSTPPVEYPVLQDLSGVHP